MNSSGNITNGIGQPVRRKEDFRLLTGRGSFAGDVHLPELAHAVIVRSPHAHAHIASVDKTAALGSPGVLAVLIGRDYVADRLGPIPHGAGLMGRPDVAVRVRGFEPITTRDYPMSPDKARFVGEPVAVVVAETIDQAKDAAEVLEIAYEPLPAVVRAADAVKPGAPRLWDNAPDNLCVDIEVGDEAATTEAFQRAAHIVLLDTWVQRVTGVPMEPRTTTAEYDPTTGHYTLYAGSGRGVAKLRLDLAEVLGVPEEQVRCVCGDMGGNFGTRNFFYPEYALLAWATRRVGRPVKWTCERSEAFLSDYQGRDLTVEAELALDDEGKFLAVRGSNLSNLGGHAAAFVSLQKGLGLMSNIYRIPVGYFRGRGAVTNTVSTTPYRSAGRPEAIFVIERLIDLAADQLGLDPVALRRQNMIPPSAQPYANPLGITYDSGRYEDAMDTALALADWDGFPARRYEARERGKLRGIGIANYVEITSGAPRERTEITVLPEGRVELVMGTMSSGQGHETSFAQLVTEWLSVPFESITYVAHDTARVAAGGGSHSGRSMKLATTIIGKATDDIIDKGRKIASFLLETGEIDIEFERGRYRVAGTDREVSIFEVAAAAVARNDLPEDLKGPLAGISDQTLAVASFPYGTQVCEVEVDPETGEVEIVRYAAVDDVGRAINPLILHGQTHGGIAQGVGQALLENSCYEPETGQLLAASFMDYGMPRADTLPFLATALSEVPAPSNKARSAFRGRRWHDAGPGRSHQRYRRRPCRAGGAPYRNAGDARAGVARHSCSCRKKNVRAPSIPEVSPRATSAPPSRRPIHRGRSTLSRRVGRWRKRARWVWRKLNAVPKALRIVVVAGTILAIFFATNLVYHVVLKPTEVFAPVSGAFNKTPIETWRQYAPLFREYSSTSVSPELLAALAQVESAGNPVASTYWRWRLTSDPFAVYQPASSAVGMYQMTDAAFAEAQTFCILHHTVVETGCSATALYSRVVPRHATELTAVFLDRKVTAILGHRRKIKVSRQQREELAAVIHLCGTGPATAFARRGFRLMPGERCGDHDVAAYLVQINAMKRQFLRLAAEM